MIDETVDQIADMRTHSSSAVALRAIEALRSMETSEYPNVEEYLRALSRNCRALRHADPSHASLYTATKRVEAAVDEAEPDSVIDAKEHTLTAIDAEHDRITTAKTRAATAAAEYLSGGGTYLTIDYSTTVLEAITIAAGEASESMTWYTPEARPRFLGRKMARELATYDGVEPRLIVDNAGATVIDRCDAIFVGMTCIVDEILINRIGTYPLALAAADRDVPMYAVGSAAKIVDDPFVFKAEERPPGEVSLEPLDGVTIENHVYDETPLSLLETVITDETQ